MTQAGRDDHAARWAWLREQTPVLQSLAFMNCGWSGPISRPVAEAMRQRLDDELQLGPATHGRMEDARRALADRLRAASASLLGVDADEIAIMPNTTEGMNIGILGMDLGSDDRVVTSSGEHAGGILPAYHLRRRRGVDLQIVPISASDSSQVVLDRFDAAIDERTRLVALSEISFSTGQVLPLEAIVEMAHARGALVVGDGAQTAGQSPLSLHAMAIDAYAVTGHKWLCGPDGMGMLYVRRDVIDRFEPAKVSFGAARSFDYVGAYEPEQESILKFEVSTVSGALIAGTVAAVELHLESGAEAVWDRVRELNRYAQTRFETVDGLAVVSPHDDATRSGLFLFTVDGFTPQQVTEFLEREARVVGRTALQGNATRLSLHVYNTEAEVDRAVDAVARLVAGAA